MLSILMINGYYIADQMFNHLYQIKHVLSEETCPVPS